MKNKNLSCGFYALMGAQFFSSLADNALLLLTIFFLTVLQEPEFMHPLLKFFFVLSYIFLAPFVGAIADAFPKKNVMLVTNLLKITGCSLLFFGVHPLLAYAFVGVAAAAYSPAKYGALTEIVPPQGLIAANGWLEGLTVASIILGTVLGSSITAPYFTDNFATWNNTGAVPGYIAGGLVLLIVVYAIATIINFWVPRSSVNYGKQAFPPIVLIQRFIYCNVVLWRDKQGQITLAATSLAWALGACMQFIILKWAQQQLGLSFVHAGQLVGVFAIGLTIGAVIAAKTVTLHNATKVLSVRFAMCGILLMMLFVHHTALAVVLLIVAGVIAGYFIVPMNALLQHRGHTLLSAGHSIAVQNFNENIAILFSLGFYAFLLHIELDLVYIVVCVVTVCFITLEMLSRRQKKLNTAIQ